MTPSRSRLEEPQRAEREPQLLFLRFARAMDVEIGGAEDELAFEDTGKFDLLHGDPCPVMTRRTASVAR